MCLVTFKGFKTLFEGFDPTILMTCSHGLWGIYCDSKVIYHWMSIETHMGEWKKGVIANLLFKNRCSQDNKKCKREREKIDKEK